MSDTSAPQPVALRLTVWWYAHRAESPCGHMGWQIPVLLHYGCGDLDGFPSLLCPKSLNLSRKLFLTVLILPDAQFSFLKYILGSGRDKNSAKEAG